MYLLLRMRSTAGDSAGRNSNRSEPSSPVNPFIFLGFRVPNNMRRAYLPIKLYEKAQLEVPWTAAERTETRNAQVDFTRSFNLEKRIERTLPVTFQVDRHDREAG